MRSMDRLLDIMATLRDPERGCPWDREQSFATVAPHTLEEAYEVEHAIREGDMGALCEELGDLLLQVVFHAQMAREVGLFDFERVAEAICEKLVRRHPHVFAGEHIATAREQTRAWEAHKARERAARAAAGDPARDGPEARGADPFDGVPAALPALARAVKLQRRARPVAGDGPALDPGPSGVLEIAQGAVARVGEARRAADATAGAEAPPAGAGDAPDLAALLFACARLASSRGIDPERALRDANAAFEERVRSAAETR